MSDLPTAPCAMPPRSRQIPTTGTVGNGGARRIEWWRMYHARATGFVRRATTVASPKARHMRIWQHPGVPRPVASPKARHMRIWQHLGVPRPEASAKAVAA